MSEILTTEQVAGIQVLWAEEWTVEQWDALLASHEALRGQLADLQAEMLEIKGQGHDEWAARLAEARQQLMDEQVRGSAVCTGWALSMQEMEADVRALAEAIRPSVMVCHAIILTETGHRWCEAPASVEAQWSDRRMAVCESHRAKAQASYDGDHSYDQTGLYWQPLPGNLELVTVLARPGVVRLLAKDEAGV